ncbi:MAG: endo alpha-1,4 polygalactosaminidase [Gemmataceae bacterium]
MQLGWLTLLVALAGMAESPPRFRATGMQLYYGSDARLLATLEKRLRPGQVVVVEPRALKQAERDRLLRAADRVGARVIGYVSIGELSDLERGKFDRFLAEHLKKPGVNPGAFRTREAMTLRRNETFRSALIDVLAEPWRAFVLAEVAAVQKAGYHGVFLDTVDSVDDYITRKDWSLERRAQSVAAMIGLVRAIKAQRPASYIVQNRGLNLLGARVFVGDARGILVPGLDLAGGHAHNPDGLLWESAFLDTDPWTLGVEKNLLAAQKSGRAAVFALGYAQGGRTPEAFFRACTRTGFLGTWASSSERLHEELTRGPDEIKEKTAP